MSLYLGETLIANTGYDKANTDLSNLTNTGKNIANWSNNVTNCITEIPQDIKLELKDGTLTLKAGSKVHVPNGFEADGTTPKFDEVTVQNDVTLNTSATNTFFCYIKGNNFQIRGLDLSTSGTTQPTSGTWLGFYNTYTNYMLLSRDSTTFESGFSLPFAIITTSSGTVTSIDQVFNGFGYIGSTVFALPGVKGLIPNGRNADGSLKNTERVIQSVITHTIDPAWGNVGAMKVIWWDSSLEAQASNRFTTDKVVTGQYVYSYIEDDNIWCYTGNSGATWGSNIYSTIAVDVSFNGTSITSFTPKTAFHAVDYNDAVKYSDKAEVVGWSMPDYDSGITYAHNTWVQAPFDCYVKVGNDSGSNLTTHLYTNTTNSDTGKKILGYIYGYACVFGAFIPKGLWFKGVTSSSVPMELVYYPLKGVN